MKTGFRGFREGLTQTWLCNQRRWLEAIFEAKTKALISCAVNDAALIFHGKYMYIMVCYSQ